MDIIILAAIAGFVLYKLYTILGQEVGFKPDKEAMMEATATPVSGTAANSQFMPASLEGHLQELKDLDPSFDANDFLNGASQAFKMILEALNKGDRETLQKLLDTNLYKIFEKVISTREKNKETWDNELIRVQSTEMIDLEIKKNNQVFISVKFLSDQILATLDESGTVIEGDPNQIEVITDIWTFTRDALSENPNWQLCKTAHGDI